MGEESSTEKEIKQIPTVNKVSAMIDDKLKSIISTNLSNITQNYKFVPNTITSSNQTFGKLCYGAELANGVVGSVQIDGLDISFSFFHSKYAVPSIEFRMGDKVVKSLTTSDGTCYSTTSGFMTITNGYLQGDNYTRTMYKGTAIIYLANIEFTDITELTDDIKLWIEQDDTFYEVATISVEKKLHGTKREGDDCIMSLYAFRDIVYPAGSIYMSTDNNIDIGKLIGGTWESMTSSITGVYMWKRTA